MDEKVQELGEKFGATEKINAVSENVDLATQVIKEEAQALQTNAQESLQAAKAAGEEYDATHEDKGLTTKLGKVGAYLSGMYGISQNKNKHYQGVDLHRESFDKDAFHAQSSFLQDKYLVPKQLQLRMWQLKLFLNLNLKPSVNHFIIK